MIAPPVERPSLHRRASRSSRKLPQSNGDSDEPSDHADEHQPVKRTSGGSSNHSSSKQKSNRRKSSRPSSSASKTASGNRKTNSFDKTSSHTNSCSEDQEEKIDGQPSVKRSSRSSERSDSQKKRSSRSRSSRGLRRMNSINENGVDTTLETLMIPSLLDTAAADPCEEEVKRSSRSSQRSDSQEKRHSRSRSSKGLQRMNSIDLNNNRSGGTDSSLEPLKRSSSSSSEGLDSKSQRPSLEKRVASTRTLRRRTTFSMERTDDETAQPAIKRIGSNNSADNNSKKSRSRSMHGRRSMMELNNATTDWEVDPLEGLLAKKNRSTSMHGRRAMEMKEADTQPDKRPRAKSTHKRMSSINTANKTENQRSSSAETKSTKDSRSRHQRPVDRDTAPGGGGEKRSSRRSKSTHRRSGGSESRSRSHEKEESSVKKRSRSRSSLRKAVENSSDKRRSNEKEGSAKEKTRSKSKSSLRRAVEKTKDLSPTRRTSDRGPVTSSKELSPKDQRSKGLLRRSKTDNDEAAQRVRSRSTHRRSVSVATSNTEEATARPSRSLHRRLTGMAKPPESPSQPTGSLHRRSISMTKREEAPSRPGGSLHKRSFLGTGKEVVKNERIPRSRRTSVDAAKQSLLDLHLNGSSANGRPRSKSPTGRKSDLRSKFVRSNSCDSRISSLSETDPVSKSELMKPFPPLKRTSTGPSLKRTSTGPAKQQQRNLKGGIERRQTIALLGSQDLSKPELEEVNKQKFADLGKKFQSSALDIYKIAGRASEAKGKLGQLPSFRDNTNGSSLTGSMNLNVGLASSLMNAPATTSISSRLSQLPSLDTTKHSTLTGAMTGGLPSLAATTPTAASIALQPIKTESITIGQVQSLTSLKGFPPIRTTIAESNKDFSDSFGTFATASSSLSQSVHSSKTTGTASTASLSLGSHSAHSRGSDAGHNLSASDSSWSFAQSVHSNKTTGTTSTSLSLESRTEHSRRSSLSNRSDPNAIMARAQRLKELSNTYRKPEEKEPFIADFWGGSKEKESPMQMFGSSVATSEAA